MFALLAKNIYVCNQVINSYMAKEKKKYPMFPIVFTDKNKDVLSWVREEASKENRSVSNFIITKLRQIKEKI